MVGNSQDQREAVYREEQARIRAERRAQEAAIRKTITILLGDNVTDQEVLEAEQRAIAAENELRRKQKNGPRRLNASANEKRSAPTAGSGR